MNYNPITSRFTSMRNPQFSKNAMVATSHPLAAQAGIEIMRQGGNAIDAAIATAAMLTVVEPTSNGIGGDAFALVYSNGKLKGINGSGPAPQSISIDALNQKGLQEIPAYGLIPVTVPGLPATWAELSRTEGRLDLKTLLGPAIKTAREGYAVTPTVSLSWQRAYSKYSQEFKDPIFDQWFKVFSPQGRAPFVGEQWRSEYHAATLEELGDTNCQSFYRGNLANRIVDFFEKNGGFMASSDLENFTPEWVEPIHSHYRGYTVSELPPNTHGISTLMALNILSFFQLEHMSELERTHTMIEAMKLAFIDTKAFVADPKHMSFDYQELLSLDYAKHRADLISSTAILPPVGKPQKGGTVYLCTADGEGNMVSYIQSNYMGFGSGIVVPETGIALHNRGHNFNMIKNHPNCIAGGKRPYHTIIPGFLSKDNQPIGPFGVMGGFMQPQGHLQVITNTLDFNMHPQDALDAPRWQWVQDKTLLVEQSFPRHLIQGLALKGHQIKVESDPGLFGRGQIIWKTHYDTYCGGTESRCDGHIAIL